MIELICQYSGGLKVSGFDFGFVLIKSTETLKILTKLIPFYCLAKKIYTDLSINIVFFFTITQSRPLQKTINTKDHTWQTKLCHSCSVKARKPPLTPLLIPAAQMLHVFLFILSFWRNLYGHVSSNNVGAGESGNKTSHLEELNCLYLPRIIWNLPSNICFNFLTHPVKLKKNLQHVTDLFWKSISHYQHIKDDRDAYIFPFLISSIHKSKYIPLLLDIYVLTNIS